MFSRVTGKMITVCFLFVLICTMGKIKTDGSNSTLNLSTAPQLCNANIYVNNWTIEDFPNPQTDTDQDRCGRNCSKSWICDPDSVISSIEANELDRLIDQINQFDVHTCPNCEKGKYLCNISIAIVSQISKEKLTSTEINQSATDFANYLRKEKWKFSSNDADIVIFLSRKEQVIGLSVGSAIRRSLSNDCFELIKYETKQKIDLGRYSDALRHMIYRLGHVLKNQIGATTKIVSSKARTVPAEAVIAGVGVLTVLLGGAAFMIKKDMDYKVKIDKKVNPNKGKLRQSFWLKKMRARRKFQRKEQAIREKYYTDSLQMNEIQSVVSQ